MEQEPGLDLILVPRGGGRSRTFHLSPRRMRWLRVGGLALTVLLVALLVSWVYLAVRSARLGDLQAAVEQVTTERRRVSDLTGELADLERRYEQLRSMFGEGAPDAGSRLWLPPAATARASSTALQRHLDPIPDAWPLAGRGFVTQSLLDEHQGAHPGIDIAVAAGTYIRAAGAGTVAEVGDDALYGRFVVLDHGGGYRTRYAHAALTFVHTGQTVRKGEVVALSGNTGRSTAPHLHFEILLDGVPVDPLTMVRPPG